MRGDLPRAQVGERILFSFPGLESLLFDSTGPVFTLWVVSLSGSATAVYLTHETHS
jgi:hypothetical protein